MTNASVTRMPTLLHMETPMSTDKTREQSTEQHDDEEVSAEALESVSGGVKGTELRPIGPISIDPILPIIPIGPIEPLRPIDGGIVEL